MNNKAEIIPIDLIRIMPAKGGEKDKKLVLILIKLLIIKN
jgi:hypothetical protein